MTQLIITEKPSASQKLAYALGDFKRVKSGRIYYFEGKISKTQAFIAPAVGHLFSLAEKEKSSKYPNFNLEWQPVWRKKESAFAKPYAENIRKLANKADEFIIATDYDIEGEVIGLNILRFLCGQQNAKRMKFSTLTKLELIKSYKSASKTLDWNQAQAGLTRHFLDFYWGINLSKAIVSAVSATTHRFRPLSIGRVQGPTISILAQREQKIAAFIPKSYWHIFILLSISGKEFQAVHTKGKFWQKEQAQQIFEKIKNKRASISKIQTAQERILPPFPFDLTGLQLEAFRCLGISPKWTLQIAQSLYEAGLISYPRTSSQKLPPTIGYKQILTTLARNPTYAKLCAKVLKGVLKPTQGKKIDPAHPAIYPTGERPKTLAAQQARLYDLIVKRFLSVFGRPALKEMTTVFFNVNEEPFILKGYKTLIPGWQEFYQPYVKRGESELPELKKDQEFDQKSRLDKKETEPPKRYTEAAIVYKLEKEGLGTKATRANIIDILYQRGYIHGRPILVTSLGQQIVKTFAQFAPEILSKELTRKFETEMEKIRQKKLAKEKVLAEAKDILIKICQKFDANKTQIGQSLASAIVETIRKQNVLCRCPKCQVGELRIIKSKKTGKRFIACSRYPNCKTTWPLPQKGKLTILDKKCKSCGNPLIVVYKFKRRPWQICPNPGCPAKKE